MPPLRPSERDVVEAWRILAAASVAPKRLVALHPGSGGTAKRWPASRFAALARWLIAEGATPVVIAGPADDDVLGTLLGSVGAADRMIVVRGASIGALVEILRTCVLYVGNDSGITHLAALVGIPVVALFGPSDPALWAPPGRRVHIIRATLDDLRNLSVEDVHSAISLLGYRDQR
jgi:heptosyltransferase-2